MSDELRDRLGEVGAAPAPAPRAEFTAALEQRLRAVHATTTATQDAPRSPRRARVLFASAAVAAAIALIVGVTSMRDTNDLTQVQLAAAASAEVVLPDGSVVAGVAGLVLPEGAIIRTGTGGRASVRGVDLGANAEGVIINGRLRVGPVRRATTTTGVPAAPPRATPSATAVAPPPSRPVPTTGAPARPAALRLSVQPAREGRVELQWSQYLGPAFHHYSVIRRVGRVEEVTATVSDVAVTTWLDQPPRAADIAYRVVALSADGRALAASQTVAARR